ncbi:MAG TPA: type 1 glutamine amidotransferase [Thermoleophilaceae bacterium]
MRVLSVVHQRDAGPGVFGEAAAARADELIEWLPREAPPPALDGFDAAMVFGGAMNVDEEEIHPWLVPEKRLLRDLLHEGTPVLGVCLGAQLLAEAAGATPGRASEPEIGWFEIELTPEAENDPVLGELPRRLEGFQWHSYEAPLPPGAVPLARTPVCLQAYRLADAGGWGIQFHAEVTREGAGRWLDDYRSDPDAVRIGLDPEALRAETDRKIDAWNETGRRLCARFLATVDR